MNAIHMPELRWKYGYPGVLAVMLYRYLRKPAGSSPLLPPGDRLRLAVGSPRYAAWAASPNPRR